MAGIAGQYPELATVACVPVGVSRYSSASEIRPHSTGEARVVVDLIHEWQELFLSMLGRRLVYAADEYYLIAGRGFPEAGTYDGFKQHENGVGMARSFELAFGGDEEAAMGTKSGFFSWVDGAPATGYRAPRYSPAPRGGEDDPDLSETPVTVITGEYGAMVLHPLLEGHPGVDVLAVPNTWFGGNIAVTGLLVGSDIAAALEKRRPTGRVLLPDVCLSQGLFLDGTSVTDLPVTVEVVPSDGLSLRRALLPRSDGESQRSQPVPVSVGATRT